MTNPGTEFIPFALPSIGREEEEAVLKVLRSGWLTTGKETQAFEAEFASKVGSTCALALNSATAGLHLSLEALGIGPGDTVVTSPYTFTATAEVVRYLGAELVFSDITPGGFNIDPRILRETLRAAEKNGHRLKALIPVHIGGEACGMTELQSIAGEFGLAIVEDAAHAFPVRSDDGRWTGTSGDTGVYSFYATKTITTGEGGMVVTDNDKIAERIRTMRLHGIDRSIWDRYTSDRAQWAYSVVEAGYKYNMTDLAAALGRVQLEKAETFLARRKEIAAAYTEAFREMPELDIPRTSGDHAWHLYILKVSRDSRINRDNLIESLRRRGVGTSVHYIPLHLMPYYRDRYAFSPGDFPNAMDAYSRCLSLPIYPGMNDAQVDRVIQAVKNGCKAE
ncbi:UDP-4-amino-4,6-dideoxy-N-acetyl-beta-L-altrosamine transaminase [Marispirochaeta aestuarii]|uniref:UDP-4-amino-4, 6-dideoxy-N-acetyl-beta-L-altrosamine transaminase n=1 Tax=Marispirochaeta aestuarii TaxID=1963862 RepID=A0A1Y1S2W0_9SPIO|nr:DegT/DnrJ/EryC1/StrS family aminotransferase [Marispirochaeta aestuarii]ORC38320.1 UDP-4-amino-4,6-dideoxy-N-acetyl-beta-L-altrosamine transaminase [Marispirochaeta aestuarii]